MKLNPNKYGSHLECATCHRVKAPRGRSIPYATANGYCSVDCDGYRDDPAPGSLWPNESEADFGFEVADAGTEIRE